MISFYPRIPLRQGCLLSIVLLLSFTVTAQKPVARNIQIHPTLRGFYESLPADYASDNDSHPLLIVVGGQGQLGNGTTELPRMISFGVGQRLNNGSLPNTFRSGGKDFSFITILPQLVSALDPENALVAMLDYCYRNYRVDTNRVYFTGASLGGGMVLHAVAQRMAGQVAAIVPMAENAEYNAGEAASLIRDNIPMWFFHNTGDPTVNVRLTRDWVTGINALNPAVPALATYPVVNDHDVWTLGSDPGYREHGVNMYEWMLSYARNLNALPVTLTSLSARLQGTGNGTTVLIEWSTGLEESNDHYTIERSTDGRTFRELDRIAASGQPDGSAYRYEDLQPGNGLVYYRLSQTDIDGRVSILGIRTVNLTAALRNGGLTLYPNPASDQLRINLSSPVRGPIQVRILNGAGLPVQTMTFNKPADLLQETITVTVLPTGYYLLEISASGYSEQAVFIRR